MDESQQFLIGQRVRLSADARGDYPDEPHWVVLAEFSAQLGQVLYGVTTDWPPRRHEDVQEGFYAADLTLWAD